MEQKEESKSIIELKREVCEAGREAAQELIKIARSPIMESTDGGEDSDLSADKLTRAAQAKKIAIMDAFEILERIDREELAIKSLEGGQVRQVHMAEARAKKGV